MKRKTTRLFLLLTLAVLAPFAQKSDAVAQIIEAASWQIEHSNTSDGVLTLTFKGRPTGNFHVYGIELPDGGPTPTGIELDESKGIKPLGPVTASPAPETHYDSNFDMKLQWYSKPFTVTQKFQITDPKSFSLAGDLIYMGCNDNTCTPPTRVSFSVTAKDLTTPLKMSAPKEGTDAEGKSTTAEAASSTDTATASGEVVEEPSEAAKVADEEGAQKTAASTVVSNEVGENNPIWTPIISELKEYGDRNLQATDSSLWTIFILGFLGGLIALLTPCVWPMIPMTVSFFLKRSQSRKKAISDAIIYGISIIVIYLALGLIITGIFGASALNSLATNAVFNIIFFLLLVVFAISFFGAFELVLPQSWTNKLDSKAESTGGLLSIFFMAFTLVLVSFSCTGPIIGTLLVDAASRGDVFGPAIGMFAFALALALPFSLFAIFPNWLQSVPKSGGWMNSVKVVLAFLELALALKFLSVADLAYGWGILDREVFVSLWIVIFTLLGLYLLGKITFPNDTPVERLSVSRLFMAIISLAFAVYMIPGLWGAPLKSISAFAPPLRTQDFNLYDAEVHPQFEDYDLGMAYAAQRGKPVLIDFSGYGCVNCRKMEASVWTDPKVKDIIDNQFVLITLIVDDKTQLPEMIEITENGQKRKLKTIGDKWSYFQRYKFGSNAQPFYVMLDQSGQPLGSSYGFDQDVNQYIDWLNSGLTEYKNQE